MPEMESRDAGLLLTPKQANPRARPTAARRYFRTNGLFAPRVSTRGTPRQEEMRPIAAASGRGLRLPAPAGPAAVGFARTSSRRSGEERTLRADTLSRTFDTVTVGSPRVPPAPLPGLRHGGPPQCGRFARLRECCSRCGLNSQLSFHTSEAQLSTLTPPPFDPPQRGHPIPEIFRDASRPSRCARSAPRRAAVSCVPCLIACALCAVPRPHAASTRRRASRGAWP